MERHFPGLVVIKGAGDLASGVACRLVRSGFSVVMTELPAPTAIRRTVSFAEAVFSGHTVIEGIDGRHVPMSDARAAISSGLVAVVTDPWESVLAFLRPGIVIDAVMAKRNTGTGITDAATVVGVGPGFTAGTEVHAVVETARGHDLGRVIYRGSAAADTGIPGPIDGMTTERLVRSPGRGIFKGARNIGDQVSAGDVVGNVGEMPVTAPIGGVLRGLLHDGVTAAPGMKIGDIDPRGCASYCWRVSDKALAVGGGVLEAILAFTYGQGEDRLRNGGQ